VLRGGLPAGGTAFGDRVEDGQHKQRQQRGRDQAADHDERKWALGLRTDLANFEVSLALMRASGGGPLGIDELRASVMP
jgi:hypothetical protein